MRRYWVISALAIGCGSGHDATPEDAAVHASDAAVDDADATPGDVDAEDPVAPPGSFSFFVTSLASLRELSGQQAGFGGDLRFGETGEGAGLRGADKICATIAELSMPGAKQKQWRAFLSTSVVDAKDRVGEGPWYDRRGRLVAMNLAGLLKERPAANAQIIKDLPNEFGVPNHDPDGTGAVDNHDTLTGSNAQGKLFCPSDPANCTCDDWTSSARSGKPRVGHSWPRGDLGSFLASLPSFGDGGFSGDDFIALTGNDGSINHWISALNEAGCAPGVSLVEMGPPIASSATVGSGGGYGGFYCFALTP